eukprot:5457575-Heterocapsa_arctica.AAC.1
MGRSAYWRYRLRLFIDPTFRVHGFANKFVFEFGRALGGALFITRELTLEDARNTYHGIMDGKGGCRSSNMSHSTQ